MQKVMIAGIAGRFGKLPSHFWRSRLGKNRSELLWTV